MRLLNKISMAWATSAGVLASGLAGATEPSGYNLVGTWQCHNPIIAQDHRIIGEDVTYQLVVYEQVHQTFFASYEVELSQLDLAPGSIEALEEAAPATDGLTTRTTDDGQVYLRVHLTGVIGPEPNRFYVIDHISDAFKIGLIDSSEHFSYVVIGLGQNAAAHNGYCIRTSRERPET